MTTTAHPSEPALAGLARTEVEVRRDPDGGRVRVRLRSGRDGPSVRPVLTGSDHRSASVALVPDGALLLAGDEVEIAVDVGPGVVLTLTEPGGTVAYPMAGGRARWSVEVRVADGACLRWHGMPFVSTAASDTRRTLDVALTGTAVLVLRETLVLGRHREPGGRIDSRTSVLRDGVPVLREDLLLDADAHQPGILGPGRVLDQVLAIGVPDLPATPQRLDLAGTGVLYRAIGPETHATRFDGLWGPVEQAWRQSVTEE
ncbi:urease accessory protein UreD [Marmoricola sp. RAF53]|uniref:urease accessory protein UreD n=1 Tax=Marmoricola sp. RAF53 TaxID=3233059 RepID=UPI003F9BFEC8